MVKRAHYAPGVTTPTSWTEYIDGIYEKTDARAITKYYDAFGRRVAMRTGSGPLTYLLADDLGSTVGAIDSTGTVSTQTYWPFGGTRTVGALGTDKLNTGQQVETGDGALGLYNYNARFYSTVLGRFASADSVTTDGLNRYVYVRNSPMNYNDPTGYGAPGIVPTLSGHPCTPDSSNDPADACNIAFSAPVSVVCALACQWQGAYTYCHSAGGIGDSDCSVPAPSTSVVAAPLPSLCSNCGSTTARVNRGGGNDCGLVCPLEHLARPLAENVAVAACNASGAVAACPVLAAAVRAAAPSVDNVLTSSCFHGILSVTAIGVGVFIVVGTGGAAGYAVWAGTGSLVLAGEAFGFTVGQSLLVGLYRPQSQPGPTMLVNGVRNLGDC